MEGTTTTTTTTTTTESSSSSSSPPCKRANCGLEIDGSIGEGGGQVLRNGISYATILQKELIINKIRAGRSKPGLKAQHMTGLKLASQICGGNLQGNELNSLQIQYQPTRSIARNEKDENDKVTRITGDTGTAGSICLLLQTALPCALFAPNVDSEKMDMYQLNLRGGTNASMAPQYDYWERVFLPMLIKKCDIEKDSIDAKVLNRGFFPRGGGEVQVNIKPLPIGKQLKAIELKERGEISRINIRSYHAGSLPRHLANDMAESAKQYFKKRVGKEEASVEIHCDVVTEQKAVGSSFGILIVAETTTGCLLAGSSMSSPKEKKKKAKDIALEACEELFSTIQDGGCVDEWLQDQLVIFMALAEGKSEMVTGSLTLHTQTAIWIATELCGAKFAVTKLDANDHTDGEMTIEQGVVKSETYGKNMRIAGKHLIQCEGIGFQRR